MHRKTKDWLRLLCSPQYVYPRLELQDGKIDFEKRIQMPDITEMVNGEAEVFF